MYIETTQGMLRPKNIFGKLLHFIENPANMKDMQQYLYVYVTYCLHVNIYNNDICFDAIK